MEKYKYIRKSVYWDGKQYFVRGKTKQEASEKLGELKAKLKRGEIGISERMSVSRWAEEWLTTYKRGKMTDKSYQTYLVMLHRYILPAIGRLKLKDVKDMQLQRILNTQAGLSFSHVSKLRMVMKQLFAQAHRSRLIFFDPSDGLTLPANEKRQRRCITQEERSAILTAAESHRFGLPILTMLYCGLRPGELPPLQWSDIHFQDGMLSVTKALEGGSDTVKGPKTASGIREIPIPSVLSRKLLRERLKHELSDYVFCKPDGSRMDQHFMSNSWRSFKKQVDLALGAEIGPHGKHIHSVVAKDLTMYCLRHTYCTDLEIAGVPLNVAKLLMGHSDVSVTANVYTHKSEEALLDAANKIERLAEHRQQA